MKIYIPKTLILVILGGFLTAFIKTSEDNKGKAKLVFLHERAFWGETVEIKINNQKVADLSSNKYFEVEVDVDNLEITIGRDNRMSKKSKPDIQANLNAESDKVYYLKIYREIDYFTNKLYLVRISEQTAKQVMKSMKLEENPLKNE
jgi:hypothetical protein